jgi:hypothetical protein
MVPGAPRLLVVEFEHREVDDGFQPGIASALVPGLGAQCPVSQRPPAIGGEEDQVA